MNPMCPEHVWGGACFKGNTLFLCLGSLGAYKGFAKHKRNAEPYMGRALGGPAVFGDLACPWEPKGTLQFYGYSRW